MPAARPLKVRPIVPEPPVVADDGADTVMLPADDESRAHVKSV